MFAHFVERMNQRTPFKIENNDVLIVKEMVWIRTVTKNANETRDAMIELQFLQWMSCAKTILFVRLKNFQSNSQLK